MSSCVTFTDIGEGYLLVENAYYIGSRTILRNNGPSLESFVFDKRTDTYRMFRYYRHLNESVIVDNDWAFNARVNENLKRIVAAHNERQTSGKPAMRKRSSSF